MLAELRYYLRMAAGVARTQLEPLPSDPEQYLRERIAARETSFLDVMRRVVFARPDHPYHRMFQHAGCEFGDLETEVHRGGLEPTLLGLRNAGVYLSHDEWKGKVPMVRGGREIPGNTRSFQNPLVHGWQEISSSGSTGRPIPSSRSSAALLHASVYQMLRAREFGGAGTVWIDVKSILPFPGGLNNALRSRRVGAPVEKWFSESSDLPGHGRYRMMTHAMVRIGNACGARAPYPEYLPPNNFAPVAEYVARRRAQGMRCIVHGFASPLVRVAAAGLEKGCDISGSIFVCGGEALSPAKRGILERAGVRGSSSYTISEIGNIGAACGQMQGSCVHLFEDSVAAVGVSRQISYAGSATVDSLHFTTLSAHPPNILINIEVDDEAVIGPAHCDCVYSRVGLRRSIDQISSFGKATPQGVTFHRTDLVEVLEQSLPARLGGGPGDYQLVECEAGNGQTQLQLRVSPRTGLRDAGSARDTFLDLIRPRFGGALAARVWTHSGGLDAILAEPIATASGKVHPIRLLGAYSRDAYRESTERAHAR